MAIGTPVSIGGAASTNANVSSIAITTTANIQAGDLIVVVVSYGSATGPRTVSSVSDGTNSYSNAVALTNTANQFAQSEIWYKANASAVSSGATLTITLSAATSGSAGYNAQAFRISGASAGSPLDKALSSTTNSTTPSIASGTLASATEILIGMSFSYYTANTYSESSGFTNAYNTSQLDISMGIGYKIVAATTGVTYQPTWAATANFDMNTLLVSFTGPATYSLTASSGSYAMTGASAALGMLYTIIATAGSYALTGAAATFTKALTIAATAGSFAFTGSAATLGKGLVMIADAGTFALTGAAATLKRGYLMVAAAGSYALTGVGLVQAVFPVATFIRKANDKLQKLRASNPTLTK